MNILLLLFYLFIFIIFLLYCNYYSVMYVTVMHVSALAFVFVFFPQKLIHGAFCSFSSANNLRT